ncbi:apurinic/apyrimidinic endonuclease family protein [Bacilliculturomica massiliensis]|uniref:TIM barrel protein n=1 Tax=Bacilliculturomica massiliensis TaxID=1917867 RepID=UPI00102FB41D|nr:TIM barrel protein [Bacilliculturomica massiliensis]
MVECIINMPAYKQALAEYEDREDLKASYEKYGCSGLEIIRCDRDMEDFISPDMILGVHMIFYPVWLDFWKGNEAGLLDEFGDRMTWEGFYGGSDPGVLLKQFSEDLEYACRVGVKYVVFHVSDVTIKGVFTHEHTHTHEEVVDAAAEIINRLLDGKDYSFDFLMENLWWPGLTMTEPAVTKRLLDSVHYPKKGIMLDLGHLMCADSGLRSEEDAIAYIHRMLDGHEALCAAAGPGEQEQPLTRFIRGVHMHQSVTGAFAEGALEDVRKNGLRLEDDYYDRFSQVYQLLGRIDTHSPFSSPDVKGLIERIAPDYVVHELAAADREERETVLGRQSRLLRQDDPGTELKPGSRQAEKRAGAQLPCGTDTEKRDER